MHGKRPSWRFYTPDDPAGSGAPTGQNPGAGAPAGNPPSDGGTQAGSSGASGDQPITNPEAKRYAEEAAKERTARKALETRVAAFEAAQKAADEAKLDELGKAQKKLADLQAAHAEYQTQAQERIVRALVRAEAASMGLNPALAARLVDFADIEFDEDGGPKNLAKLLKKAAEDYGLTPAAGQGQGAPRPPVSSGGATAPGAGARAGTITKAAYQAMSAQERVARNAEVMQTLRQNGGRLPD